MFQFFESVLNFISSIVDFVINTFTQVTVLIGNATLGVVYLMAAVNFLPVFLVPFVTALIGIAIVKFILSFGER